VPSTLTPAGTGGTAPVENGDVLSVAFDGDGPFTLSWRTAPAPAPTLALPAAMTLDAVAPEGRTVEYTASALDWKGRSLTPICSKSSGYVFPIGTTTVTCEATDAGGRSATASFDVHVNGVPEQLTALDGRVVTAQLTTRLTDKLRGSLADTQKQFAAGRTTAACSELNGFLDTVAKNDGTAIPAVQADGFRQNAWQIRAVLNCA